MTKTQLVNAAKELNEVFCPEPSFNLKGNVDNLEAEVAESISLFQEGDKISEETRGVWAELDWEKYLDAADNIEVDEDTGLTTRGSMEKNLHKLGIWPNVEEEEETEEEETEEEETEEVQEDLEEEETEEEDPKPKKTTVKKTPKKENTQVDKKKPKEEKPKKKRDSGNKVLKESNVIKGLKFGDTVIFTAAARSKLAGKTLKGTVAWVKWDAGANNEYIQIKTKEGDVFHKTTKSVEKVK